MSDLNAINAMNFSYDVVRFQDTPGLLTSLRIDRSSVPEGMHCYDIRGENDIPYQLSKENLADCYGTLITSDPIQLSVDGRLFFEASDLNYTGEGVFNLEHFRKRHPPTGRDVMEFFIAKPKEIPLTFIQDDEQDAATGCIGYMEGSFVGGILTDIWHNRYWCRLYDNASFQTDLKRVIAWLRTGFSPLRDLETMAAFCARHKKAAIPEVIGAYGFRIETNCFRYVLQCTPLTGSEDMLLYCFTKKNMRSPFMLARRLRMLREQVWCWIEPRHW